MKILTLLFILSCTIGFAQRQKEIDNLKHELTIAKQDTSRVRILNHLCERYRTYHVDSSLYFGQSALFLSRRIKYP